MPSDNSTEYALQTRLKQRIDGPSSTGRGVAIATIHLGHWELMAAALARRGFSVLAVSARMKPSPLHLRLGQLRRRLGVRTVQPGGGARTLIRTLKDKGTISIFIDQNTNEQSRDLPFLGLRPNPHHI